MTELTVAEVDCAFRELEDWVGKIPGLHPLDKMSLIGCIKVRKSVEIVKARDREKMTDRRLKNYLRKYGYGG